MHHHLCLVFLPFSTDRHQAAPSGTSPGRPIFDESLALWVRARSADSMSSEPMRPRLAPVKSWCWCRCTESPVVRGLRHNASRRALAAWSFEAKKSKKTAGALKRMTPEGRLLGAGFRSWHEKLLEARRMKQALAKISPSGRAMCACYATTLQSPGLGRACAAPWRRTR